MRLRSTSDDTVAVAVELSRFHDSAALALAAALYLAVPRRRGRPPRARTSGAFLEPKPPAAVADGAERLARLLDGIPVETPHDSGLPFRLLSAFFEREVPAVVTGVLASAFHVGAGSPQSIDLVVDLSTRHARTLATLLNHFGAKPRGVRVRETFALDSTLVRAAPCLALRVGSLAVNVSSSLPGVGEFPQVSDSSIRVEMGGGECRVLSIDGLSRALNALPRSVGAA